MRQWTAASAVRSANGPRIPLDVSGPLPGRPSAQRASLRKPAAAATGHANWKYCSGPSPSAHYCHLKLALSAICDYSEPSISGTLTWDRKCQFQNAAVPHIMEGPLMEVRLYC